MTIIEVDQCLYEMECYNSIACASVQNNVGSAYVGITGDWIRAPLRVQCWPASARHSCYDCLVVALCYVLRRRVVPASRCVEIGRASCRERVWMWVVCVL